MAKVAGIVRQLKEEQDQLTRQLKTLQLRWPHLELHTEKVLDDGESQQREEHVLQLHNVRDGRKSNELESREKSSGLKKRPSDAPQKKNRRPAKTAVKLPAATSTK